jgi:hypothetical protein
LLVASILSVDYLATSDGPERIFGGYMQNHLHDAGRGYDRFLRLQPTLTDCGFETVFAQFEPHLGWRSAYRATLCLVVLLWAWGVLALAMALGQRHAWLGLLGFACALQWSFYMGQFSFQMGCGLGFLVLAWAWRRREPTLLARVLLAALLLTQVMVHAFAAILTRVALLVHGLFAAERGRRLRAALAVGIVGLPAAAIAVWTLLHHLGNAGAGEYNYPPTPFVDRLILLGRGFTSGPWWRAWPPTLLAVWALARPRWRERDARERALAVVGLALFACAALLPLHTRDWEFFSVRFTPDAVVFLMLLAAPTASRRAGSAVLAGAVLAYAAGAIAWSWHHHVRIHRASADLWAGLHAPIRRSGLRLPLPLEPPPGEDRHEWRRDIPYTTYNGHLGALYAIEQGGVPAVSFAGLSLQGIDWREPLATWMPPRPSRGLEWQLWEPKVERNPRERRAGLIHYLAYAPPFADVILHARPGDAALLRELGFVVDFQHGGLFLARFSGCALSVTALPPAGGPVPLLISAGFVPNPRPVFATAIAAEAAVRPRQLTRMPCGEAWLRIVFDMDGNGVLSAGDRACAAANAAGIVVHRVRPAPDENSVVCAHGPALAPP